MKIAMLGRSEGNGHPYSWSAIINGYDKDKMAELCPFKGIVEYLSKEPDENFGIDGARVTHIWTEDYQEAERIAQCTYIENVVENMTDVIGEVDAVIIGEDVPEKHLEMAKPFIENDIPIFIDKPLCNTLVDLQTFVDYFNQSKLFMSCSSGRYAKEYIDLAKNVKNKGKIRSIHLIGNNSWEKYGIHLLEPLMLFIDDIYKSIQFINSNKISTFILHTHDDQQIILQNILDFQAPMSIRIIGENYVEMAEWQDHFDSFKQTLEHFIKMVSSRKHKIDFKETITLTKILIAGIKSKEKNGKKIYLEDL